MNRAGRIALTISAAAVATAAVAAVAIVAFPRFFKEHGPAKLALLLPPALPDPRPIREARWLPQNWADADRQWFHHATQGTATFPVPYTWFIALEQPQITLFGLPDLLSDGSYLERMGFIPSPTSLDIGAEALARYGLGRDSGQITAPVPDAVLPLTGSVGNPDALPVGFSRTDGSDSAGGPSRNDRIGLTCAACHTGHVSYKGVSLRFDGGPASVDLHKLEEAMGLAIFYTLNIPGRFDRFADRVLATGTTEDAKVQLRAALSEVWEKIVTQTKITNAAKAKMNATDTDEGAGRLDALNRIGNQVFFSTFQDAGMTGFEGNVRAQTAPVSFPPIWTVPWFAWAQYDASIEHPLVRNVGEALGVAALLNLGGTSRNPNALFQSSVALGNVARIEQLLAGPNPFATTPPAFAGLASPKWPSVYFSNDRAWGIDAARADRGHGLYSKLCAECHLSPIDERNDSNPANAFWSSDRWSTIANSDTKALRLRQLHVDGIGTDPEQSLVLANRTVTVPDSLDIRPERDLGKRWGCNNVTPVPKEIPFAQALMVVVDRVIQKWFSDRNVPAETAAKVWGAHSNCPNPESHVYRARPLNGVWATAPYLHNGSVPSLYWMLSPQATRPKRFCIGARDFDPKQVGYAVQAGEEQSCAAGEAVFVASTPDAPIRGNSNLGHSFEGDGTLARGIIGRVLTEDERYEIIEYLKTL